MAESLNVFREVVVSVAEKRPEVHLAGVDCAAWRGEHQRVEGSAEGDGRAAVRREGAGVPRPSVPHSQQ